MTGRGSRLDGSEDGGPTTPRRLGLAVLALLAVLATPMAAAALSPPAVAGSSNGSSPGSTAAGTVASQGATIATDVRTAAFEDRFEAAGSPTGRAAVLASELNRTEREVQRLEQRLERLRAARANGSLSEPTFESRTARLAAQARTQRAVLARVQNRTDAVDPEARRQAGVTADRIAALRDRIDALTAVGPDGGAEGRLGPGFYRSFGTVVATYNEDVASRDLGVLGTYLDDERINLHIVTEDGDAEVVSFRTTAESKVRELRAGPHPDAGLRITVDESTARAIVESEDPVAAANEAFLEGDIEIDGLGTLGALKWLAVNAVLGVVQFVVGVLDFLAGVVP